MKLQVVIFICLIGFLTASGCLKQQSSNESENQTTDTPMTENPSFLQSEKLDLGLKQLLSESMTDSVSTLIPVVITFRIPPDSLLVNFVRESESQQVVVSGSTLSGRIHPSVIKELDEHDDVKQISLSQTRNPLNN